MASEHQIEMSVTHIFLALNTCASFDVDYKKVIDYWLAAKAEGRIISEEDMKAFAATLVN